MSRNWFIWVLFLALAVYSVGMLAIEVVYGQEVSRAFFSDIICGTDYPIPKKQWFGINTSVCVILLFGSALLYALCLAVKQAASSAAAPGQVRFQFVQLLLFLYLAADDRLKLHETLGARIGMEDAFILFGIGAVHVITLFLFGRIQRQRRSLQLYQMSAGGFFVLMVIIDAFFPKEMCGRLALEDLSKLWAVFLLFLYAWNYTRHWVQGESLFKAPEVLS